jgi:hypothetical protein
MEEHTARDNDNNWQYENTVHLWIQLQTNFALQQQDTGMRCGYSSSTGGYLICNWQPEYLSCELHTTVYQTLLKRDSLQCILLYKVNVMYSLSANRNPAAEITEL